MGRVRVRALAFNVCRGRILRTGHGRKRLSEMMKA